jgi:hypothetical protein
MKSLFLIALLFVSCAKSGSNGKKVEEVAPVVPVEEVEQPLEIGEFEEEIKNTVINTARKVLFSENLKDITRVKLEVENIFKVETSYKTTTLSKKYCYNDATPVDCSGVWCISFPIVCTDASTYSSSDFYKKYGNLGYLPNANKKLSVTYRTLNPWQENKFKDDVTLSDLGIELFINDKFIDISKKDLAVNTDSGDVNKLMVEFDIPQVEEGQLKLVAKPVYEEKTVVVGKVSPALYPCTMAPHGKSFTAYVLNSGHVRDGKCIERTSYPENIFHVEDGISSKTENITSRNKFDLKLRIQATRMSEQASSEEE